MVADVFGIIIIKLSECLVLIMQNNVNLNHYRNNVD